MLVLDQLKKSDIPLRVVTVFVLCGLLVLLGGLWYVQVMSSKQYVDNQISQSYRSVRVPAVRGRILDRNQLVLAENRPSYGLCLYLEEMSKLFQASYAMMFTNVSAQVKKTANRKLTREERTLLGQKVRYMVVSNLVQRVSVLLEQPITISEHNFRRHYEERLALPLTILANLGSNQVARLQELPIVPTGMDIEIQPTRVYPNGSTASHIIGYLSRDDMPVTGEDAFFNYLMPDYKGVIGIEGAFEEQLRGKAGYKSVMVNSMGYRQSESVWSQAEAGQNIVLTIDLPIQREVERALHSAREGVRGAAIVLDVLSGDVLAMASAPSFDPSLFIPSISKDDMAKLNDPFFRPLINRATQERYAPGSIFKIITSLACLESGLNPAEQTTVIPNPMKPGKGCVYIGRRRIDDTAPPGPYDFKLAFIKSSNSYFIEHGLKSGLKSILDMGHQFHLGENIGIPTRQSDHGIFPDAERVRGKAISGTPWMDGDTANLCIGQGDLAVNPMQMAVMVAAVANGGKVFWPRLVQRIEPLEQTSMSNEGVVHYPVQLRNVLRVKPVNLQIVRDAMLADVEDPNGTGRESSVPGMRVGGKTGTAEVQHGGRLTDKITWFASFAPYESPRYAVVVMVESGGSGGGTCAPVARKIYQAIVDREKGVRSKPETVAQL